MFSFDIKTPIFLKNKKHTLIWFNTVLFAQKNPYHLVTKSPWPLMLSIFLGLFVFLMVIKIHYQIHFVWIHLSIYLNLFVISNWCINILTESLLGFHTRKVRKGLRLGFFLMILSEIMFFASFISSLFYYAIFTNCHVGQKWPYVWGFPPLNGNPWVGTLFLITSSFWISESKVNFYFGDVRIALYQLIGTLWCGIMFLIIQAEEFLSLNLSFNSGAQSSLFFMLTGFHGLHVFIGMVFILFLYLRIIDGYFIMIREKSILFDITVWYWHFVDYVWIFLFIILYGFFGQSFLDIPK